MSVNSASNPPERTVASMLTRALRPTNIIPTALASIFVWLIAIVLSISFSALIFHDRLSGFYGAGIGIALVSGIVISGLAAIFGSDHATIAFPQSTAAAILGAMSTSMIASAPPSMPDDVLFLTLILTISFASFLTGLFFLILGVLRAGNLIRYIPYPVIGGFLAGSGWILVQGALNVMVDMRMGIDTFFTFFENGVLMRWLPGLILGVVALILVRRKGNVLYLPAVIVSGLVLFYGVILSGNSGIDVASKQGWFLESFSGNTLWHPPNFSAITQIDGMMVIAQASSLAALIIISTLHLLLNASGLELVVDREIDFNHELTITGAGNVLSSLLGGGIIGFPSVTFTTLVHRMGGYGRVVGIALSLLLGLTVIFGASFITIFPRIILGGLLMYLGFNFLVEWLYDAWFKLPLKDYLIMLVILLVIGTFGFLQGVAVGIIATIVLFVHEYSQISVVKQEFSGKIFRSNIDRSYNENELLHELGQCIWVFRLQGFIFFGTSHQFYQRIKARVLDPDQEALLFVILDFRLVRGIDVSTVVYFTKLKQLAAMHGIQLILTSVAPHIEEILVDCGFGALESDVSRQFPDLDHAMEWCENDLLAHADVKSDTKRITVQEQFESRTMTRMLDVSVLSKYLERVNVKNGEYLVHQGDEPDSLYFIESGRVDIQLELEHGAVRLRSMGSGTIIGEVGFYLGRPRSASIIVTENGVFHKLTRDALERMSRDYPESASGFHVFIACVVSERLSATNRLVQALID